MIERRTFEASELRAVSGDKPRITGHAAVFNQLSQDLGGFREKIDPGTFADTIEKDDIRALWNHDPNFVLARNKSGTLKLSEDKIGLKIDAELIDAPFERELLQKIERGDVDQMSFGFRVLPDGDKWEMHEGAIIRTLRKVVLYDVSPVTYAAYTQTDVAARSLFDAKIAELRSNREPDELEKAEFRQRMKARRSEYIDRRTSPPDPYSYNGILKICRDPYSYNEILRSCRKK